MLLDTYHQFSGGKRSRIIKECRYIVTKVSHLEKCSILCTDSGTYTSNDRNELPRVGNSKYFVVQINFTWYNYYMSKTWTTVNPRQ